MSIKEKIPVNKETLKERAIKKWRDTKKNANITRELVKKNIKIQYRNSVIGIFWTVLNPFLNMLVMYFVFGTILNYSETDKTYALYLLCGNIIFNMMRGATSQSLTSLVHNRGLLTKNKISYYVFPLSNNLSALVNFLFSCIALLGVMLFVWIRGESVFSWNILLAFLMLPALFLFNYGMSMILATLYVFFRDIQHFYTVFLTLWTYLTPIFYKIDKIDNGKLSGKFIAGVINLNPMYHYVEYFRDVIYRCSSTGQAVPGNLMRLYLIGAAFFVIGVIVYNFTKRKYIFYI
ncbi:MAG: ABC transporter permease [Clostridia bacterium]|nr:ABC transporter permease [Clostridia bacterium]MBO5439056.1 ABC transporter permease [Clostridia bacterium]